MTSGELSNYLTEFNINIDSKIDEYSSVSASIDKITSDINTVKGSDVAVYNGLIENNEKAKKQVNKIIKNLTALKNDVNVTTKAEIRRLYSLEEAERRRREEEDNNG